MVRSIQPSQTDNRLCQRTSSSHIYEFKVLPQLQLNFAQKIQYRLQMV